jgi:hypothetical protein
MVVHVDPDHRLLYFAHRDDICPSEDVDSMNGICADLNCVQLISTDDVSVYQFAGLLENPGMSNVRTVKLLLTLARPAQRTRSLPSPDGTNMTCGPSPRCSQCQRDPEVKDTVLLRDCAERALA